MILVNQTSYNYVRFNASFLYFYIFFTPYNQTKIFIELMEKLKVIDISDVLKFSLFLAFK